MMDHALIDAEMTAADLAREQELNGALLEGEIRVDVAHFLKTFDEFYADEVEIREDAAGLPVRGKAENRGRLEQSMIAAHLIYEQKVRRVCSNQSGWGRSPSD